MWVKEGSTGSATPERERIAQYGETDDATVERIYKGLVSSEKFKRLRGCKSRKALAATFKYINV